MDPGTTPPGEMTIPAMRAEYAALGAHLSEISVRRKLLIEEYERRIALANMQAVIDNLSEDKREAARIILCE